MVSDMSDLHCISSLWHSKLIDGEYGVCLAEQA